MYFGCPGMYFTASQIMKYDNSKVFLNLPELMNLKTLVSVRLDFAAGINSQISLGSKAQVCVTHMSLS